MRDHRSHHRFWMGILVLLAVCVSPADRSSVQEKGQIPLALGFASASAAYGSGVPAGENRQVPLALGFANLSGDDLDPLVAEDAAALSPLFKTVSVAPPHQLPTCQILFLYAHLNDDGTIRGTSGLRIRQVVEMTKSAIVVLASPNSGESINNAAASPGSRSANLVFTFDRNSSSFARFFRALFEHMRDGDDMLSAWVGLAPQGPPDAASTAPDTMLLPEAGALAFRR